MGKGGGCVPSKKRAPAVASPEERESEQQQQQTSNNNDIVTTHVEENNNSNLLALPSTTTAAAAASKLKIFIVFYSMYGHVEGLAKRMKKGVDLIEGVQGYLYRVPETLSIQVLEQMKVPQKDGGIEVISNAEELVQADGILFGFPARYGSMAAQMKSFFDSTGQLWKEQKLAGKPGGFFVSTGTQGGGQETTAEGFIRGGDPLRFKGCVSGRKLVPGKESLPSTDDAGM
ncbi:hypothetical protein IFM89_039454 [Coptis chinensis]|uniref:NAD(P)H dehydrogenase (quinone) n=1 Tax=Coptis chinensis TaxID=261450 RepID=A0A835I718_9MAGN|nr:hypothetical protein IFM89_039454 [Coptis chinensis]